MNIFKGLGEAYEIFRVSNSPSPAPSPAKPKQGAGVAVISAKLPQNPCTPPVNHRPSTSKDSRAEAAVAEAFGGAIAVHRFAFVGQSLFCRCCLS
jgi:hypothetical protein